MKTNKERQKHFTTFSSPTPNEVGYKEFMEAYDKRIANNPKLRKESKEKFERAVRILKTQSKNGAGLSADKELRFFLTEFNSRVWNYGFGALPASFNVLEAFFNWNPDLFFFELNEEEEHLFSLFDFVDFITSKDCSDSIEKVTENIQESLIYSYTALNALKEITFKTDDSKEFVISGIAFIRRGIEISMLVVAGEICDTDIETKNLPNLSDSKSLKPYLDKNIDNIREAVKLNDQKDLWKKLVYARINLESKTIDARYIQSDDGDSYSTITDDVGMFLRSLKGEEELEELINSQIVAIKRYDPLFEIAQKFLFLPEYFDFYDKYIVNEEHPTDLLNETNRRQLTKKTPPYSSNHFIKSKDVWVLDRATVPEKRSLLITETDLHIEKDGYWKYLEPGKVGTDKNGNPIHNRTWVEKTLSWYQTQQNINLKVSISNNISHNSGFIYLLRNPAHDLDIFKIGLTRLTVEERAKQLSGTPSPDKFTIISRWQVDDCVLAEKLIHSALDSYRLNPKREFFKVSIEKAIEVILPIIKQVNEKNTK